MLKESNCADSYYDYICIIDFEATCEEGNPSEFIHEIIEFPVVLLNTQTLEIVSELLHFKFTLTSTILVFTSEVEISFDVFTRFRILKWAFCSCELFICLTNLIKQFP